MAPVKAPAYIFACHQMRLRKNDGSRAQVIDTAGCSIFTDSTNTQ